MSLQKRDNHLIRPTTDKGEREGERERDRERERQDENKSQNDLDSSAGTELSTKARAGKEIYNQDSDKGRKRHH